jgi:hypothetical protein
LVVTLGTLAAPPPVLGHGRADVPESPDLQRIIQFPDTREREVMVVDLHTHSVFSDGHVWPRTRVEEALRDGLDALAITEHLEWTPHRGDINLDDRNRAWEIAHEAAAGTDLIVIAGSEITRRWPVGHINAIFIEDANPLLVLPEGAEDIEDLDEYYDAARSTDPRVALDAAHGQGAFIFWNHPAWSSPERDGIATLSEFHLEAIERGQLHGIEVANWDNLSEEAFQIALDHDLTVLGVSDVHELIDWDYEPHTGGHRPVTLALVEERSEDGLKKALFDGRTVVWYRNTLLGRARDVQPVLEASITVDEAYYAGDEKLARVTLRNDSDARFLLSNETGYSFEDGAGVVELPANGTLRLGIRTKEALEQFNLTFKVLNALIAPGSPATVTVPIQAEFVERQ